MFWISLLLAVLVRSTLIWKNIPTDQLNQSQLEEALSFATTKLNDLFKLDTLAKLHYRDFSNLEVKESFVRDRIKVAVEKKVRFWDPFENRPVTIQLATQVTEPIDVVMDTVYSMALFFTPTSNENLVDVTEGREIVSEEGMQFNVTISVDHQHHLGMTRCRWFNITDFISADLSATVPLAPQFIRASVEKVSVMSINLWNYNHWDARKQMLLKNIEQHRPDVIGFQEVRARKRSPHANSRYQIEDLASLVLPKYRYHYVFEPAMGFQESDSEYIHEGLAIFSKYPISSYDSLELTRIPGDGDDFHQRLCLRASINTPIGPINFMTTHLSLSAKARVKSLNEIGEYSQKFADPSILVGDFNMVIDENTDVLGKYGFYDAWKNVHPELPEKEGWTFNSWDMKSRIDYIMVKGLKTLSVQVVGNEGEKVSGYRGVGGVSDLKDTMYASDHRFLLAHLTSSRS